MNAVEIERGLDTMLRLAHDAAPQFLLGSSAILAAGCLATWTVSAPIRRLRIAEGTLFAIAIWLVLAIVPLPRFAWQSAEPAPVQIGRATIEIEPPGMERSSVSPTEPRADRDAATIDLPPKELAADVAPPREPAAETAERQAPSARRVDQTPTTESVPRHSRWRPERREVKPDTRLSAPSPDVDPPVALAQVAIPIDWGRVAVVVYMAGAFCVAAWLLVGRLLLFLLVRRAEPTPGWLQEVLDQSNRSGRSVELVVSRRCHRPMSFGLWRPVVVLPETLCRKEARGALEHVLRHELAHVAQRDARGHLLFNLLFPLLYVHPLYWRLRMTAHLSREMIADDAAARESSPADYAREMLAMVRGATRGRLAWGAALGLWSAPSQFYRRMSQLLERQAPLATDCPRTWRWCATAAIAVTVVLAAGQWGVRASWSPLDRTADDASAHEIQATIEQYLQAERLARAAQQRAQTALAAIESLVARVERLEKELTILERDLASAGKHRMIAPPIETAPPEAGGASNLLRLADAYFDARVDRDRVRVALANAEEADRPALEAALVVAERQLETRLQIVRMARDDAAAEVESWQTAARLLDAGDPRRLAFETAARKAGSRRRILDATLNAE